MVFGENKMILGLQKLFFCQQTVKSCRLKKEILSTHSHCETELMLQHYSSNMTKPIKLSTSLSMLVSSSTTDLEFESNGYRLKSAQTHRRRNSRRIRVSSLTTTTRHEIRSTTTTATKPTRTKQHKLSSFRILLLILIGCPGKPLIKFSACYFYKNQV